MLVSATKKKTHMQTQFVTRGILNSSKLREDNERERERKSTYGGPVNEGGDSCDLDDLVVTQRVFRVLPATDGYNKKEGQW